MHVDPNSDRDRIWLYEKTTYCLRSTSECDGDAPSDRLPRVPTNHPGNTAITQVTGHLRAERRPRGTTYTNSEPVTRGQRTGLRRAWSRRMTRISPADIRDTCLSAEEPISLEAACRSQPSPQRTPRAKPVLCYARQSYAADKQARINELVDQWQDRWQTTEYLHNRCSPPPRSGAVAIKSRDRARRLRGRRSARSEPSARL